jgi:tetratricopeptide (TPR) repeat protein
LHRLPDASEADLKEVLLLPPARVIRQVDLGHHTLAADLLFIRTNLYYGHHIFSDEQVPWLADFLQVLLQVDPYYKKPYLWGAMATLFPEREMLSTPPELVHRANRILEAGMQRFPDDHRFPMRLAFNHYYELGDPDTATRYFERAAATPGSPGWIKQKLVDLYSAKGRLEIARDTLLQILAEETDPVLSSALQARLAQVMEKAEREKLLTEREALVRQWRQRYAYISFDLFLLIREP